MANRALSLSITGIVLVLGPMGLMGGMVGCTSSDHASPQSRIDAQADAKPEQIELQFERTPGTATVPGLPNVKAVVQLRPAGYASRLANPISQSIWSSLQYCPAVREKLGARKAPVTISFSVLSGKVYANASNTADPIHDPSTRCLLKNLRATDFPALETPVLAVFQVVTVGAQAAGTAAPRSGS